MLCLCPLLFVQTTNSNVPFDKALHSAVVKLEAAALAKAKATGKRTDDISVIVTVFEGYRDHPSAQ
jgi:hypothetical protein